MAKTKGAIIDFEAMFQQYVDDHQKVWDHDRSETVGASEVFACMRQTWFKKFGEKNGFETDPDHDKSWGAMERGNIMEEHWVVPVMEHNAKKGAYGFEFGSDGQVTFVYGQNSATPDGLFTGLAKEALKKYGIDDIESDCILLEIKSIDPRATLDEEKAIHFGQAQTQLGIIRKMTEHKPMYCVVIYINASFYDDIKVFPIRYEEDMFKRARARAKMIMNATNPDRLMPEGKLSDACKLCEWTHACAKVQKEVVPTSDESKKLDQVIVNKARELAIEADKYAEAEKEAKATKEMVRNDIKALLGEANTKKAMGEDFSISWIWQDGNSSLDKEAMKADGIDLSKYEKKGAGFEKMLIKVKKP